MDIAVRIVEILFPLFSIATLGYFVGRRMKPDLSQANKLNMDVFVPALAFAALANFWRAYETEREWVYHVTIGIPALLFALAYGLDLAGVIDPLHFGNGTNLLRTLQVSVMLILGSFAVRRKRS